MSENQEFTGLTMPVFTAFGWAGEENALKFALAQLELFIGQLHRNLPGTARSIFSNYGLNQESRAVYLAASPDIEEDVHVGFLARPMSLELQIAITDTNVLAKGWKQVLKNIPMVLALLQKLEPSWTLRIQQMQLVEGAEEPIHYQDIYKDAAKKLDEATAKEVFEKAAYLNGEEKWITPIYLSQRVPSEQVAAMSLGVVPVMSEKLSIVMPLIMMFSGRATQKAAAKKPKAKKTAAAKKTAVSTGRITPTKKKSVGPSELVMAVEQATDELFTYVATVKPLHIRRGFINMTPEHWPVFAKNARSETRAVVVNFQDDEQEMTDKDSTVWRLQPTDMARLMLGPTAHRWLEESFQPNDKIKIIASQPSNDEIQIELASHD
ncbi:MAG: hypothetical protein AAF614_03620 [Chloroflexota bacterium]